MLDLAVMVQGYKTTKSDPTDRTIRVERYLSVTRQHFDQDKYEFYCHICEAHVLE
jgi:hypothetical protein